MVKGEEWVKVRLLPKVDCQGASRVARRRRCRCTYTYQNTFSDL
jgi:hypothetical protein